MVIFVSVGYYYGDCKMIHFLFLSFLLYLLISITLFLKKAFPLPSINFLSLGTVVQAHGFLNIRWAVTHSCF